jgi:hypothetical protein
MLLRTIIAISLALIGIVVGLYLFSGNLDTKTAGEQSDLIAVKENIDTLSKELSLIARSIHENDSKRAVFLINSAKSQADSTQSALHELRARINQVPQRIPGFFRSQGFSWDKETFLQRLSKLENDLKKSRKLISDASIKMGSVSMQVVGIDQRVAQLDLRMKSEIKRIQNSIANAPTSAESVSKIWMPMMVSIIGVITSIFTMYFGWREDKRELVKLILEAHAKK